MSTVIETDSNGNPLIAGDNLDLHHDVIDLTVTDPLVKAWFTVKTAQTGVVDPGSLQKIITTTPVAGTGHIVQDGSQGNGDGTASLRFELSATDTATLGYTRKYFWDIQCKTNSGKIYTPEDGTIQWHPGVTDATS